MSVHDTSKVIIDDSKVMLQIVTSLIDDTRSIICNHNILILQARVHFLNEWVVNAGCVYGLVDMSMD